MCKIRGGFGFLNRVNEDIPMAFTNVSKDQIEERNLGQDLPILLNFLPNVLLRLMLALESDIQLYDPWD